MFSQCRCPSCMSLLTELGHATILSRRQRYRHKKAAAFDEDVCHDDGDSSASPCQQDDPPAPDLQDDPPALAAHQPQGAPNVPPQPPPTEADLRNRGGRPPLAREFANPALGILLLDMRDKFPSMTELCQDDQFCLQNATHNLGVDAAISGRYARRCAMVLL